MPFDDKKKAPPFAKKGDKGDDKKPADKKPSPFDKGGASSDPFGDEKIKPVADAADAVLKDAGLESAEEELAEGAPAPGAEGAEGAAEPGGDLEVAPLVQELGVDEDRARAIMQAAEKFPETRALTCKDLAEKLSDDFKLRMRVETEAARIMDTGDAASREAALGGSPPGAPPPGAPPEGKPSPFAGEGSPSGIPERAGE